MVSSTSEKDYAEEKNVPIEVELDASENVQNMSVLRKWVISILVTLAAMAITMCSSCWALAQKSIMEEFNVSEEVSILGITFFIFGIGFGPIFLSPISEYHGRKVVFTAGLALSIAFQFLTAFCQNIGGMLFGRFMSGFFGSAFLAVAGGAISDIFSKEDLSLPLSLFSLGPFLGPGLGPLMSGFIVASDINYRWIFYIIIIFCGTLFILITFLVPETYKPFLLKRKAANLRTETGDSGYYSPIDEEVTMFQSIILSCNRPILLLARDPMMLTLCLYTGLVLSILYLFFDAIPYIFENVYHFGPRAQGMTFIGLIVGLLLASPTAIVSQHIYLKLAAKNNFVGVPEYRFPPLMLGGLVTPAGLIIMAWTAYESVHWIGVIIGSSIFGIGIMLVFYGIVSYTVEGYRLYAASALAANACVRAIMAGVFPLFSNQMYSTLGVHWATMLLALISLAMTPIPFFFYRYGSVLRSKSPYAWSE